MNIWTSPNTNYEKEQKILRKVIQEKISYFQMALPQGGEKSNDNPIIALLKRKREKLENLYRECAGTEKIVGIIDEIDEILRANPTILQPAC